MPAILIFDVGINYSLDGGVRGFGFPMPASYGTSLILRDDAKQM